MERGTSCPLDAGTQLQTAKEKYLHVSYSLSSVNIPPTSACEPFTTKDFEMERRETLLSNKCLSLRNLTLGKF